MSQEEDKRLARYMDTYLEETSRQKITIKTLLEALDIKYEADEKIRK
jgi:hypothetical protein